MPRKSSKSKSKAKRAYSKRKATLRQKLVADFIQRLKENGATEEE